MTHNGEPVMLRRLVLLCLGAPALGLAGAPPGARAAKRLPRGHPALAAGGAPRAGAGGGAAGGAGGFTDGGGGRTPAGGGGPKTRAGAVPGRAGARGGAARARRFREAENYYRRSAAGAEEPRRSRSVFGLGNSLL